MPFLPSFSVPLRSTSKEGKNIIPNFDFIFYLKWVTSIYNADLSVKKEKISVDTKANGCYNVIAAYCGHIKASFAPPDE